MHGGLEQQKYKGLQPAILRQWKIMWYVYIANQLDIMFEDIWDFRGVWNFPVMAILGEIMMITHWVEGDIYPIFRQTKVFADETMNWKLASFLMRHMTLCNRHHLWNPKHYLCKMTFVEILLSMSIPLTASHHAHHPNPPKSKTVDELMPPTI
jgi:hypothetical protein